MFLSFFIFFCLIPQHLWLLSWSSGQKVKALVYLLLFTLLKAVSASETMRREDKRGKAMGFFTCSWDHSSTDLSEGFPLFLVLDVCLETSAMGLPGRDREKQRKNSMDFFHSFQLLESFILSLDKTYRASLGTLSAFTWCALATSVLPLSLGWEILEKEKQKLTRFQWHC